MPESLVANIGFDGSGTHSDKRLVENNFAESPISIKSIPLEENQNAKASMGKHLKSLNHYEHFSLVVVFKKVVKKILSLLHLRK